MSTTFERLQLAPSDDGPAPWPAETYRMALKAAYAEMDRLTSDVEFWKQQQIDACVEANGLAVQCEQQEAEIDRLRANALEWHVVTEDPATLPEKGRPVFIQSGRYYFAGHRNRGVLEWIINPRESSCGVYPVSPGDRWAYIPKPDEVPA